jgi:ABC-2 type transport system permease protein
MLRDPMTLFFILFISMIELLMLGDAIDTNVRHVSTVILDQAGTQESRQLVQRIENAEDLKIVKRVFSVENLHRVIVADNAHVGLIVL